jgi:hypothetical protein
MLAFWGEVSSFLEVDAKSTAPIHPVSHNSIGCILGQQVPVILVLAIENEKRPLAAVSVLKGCFYSNFHMLVVFTHEN